MKPLWLLALAPLTLGAAPQQQLPHCHVWGPFVLFFERGSTVLDARSREVLDYSTQIFTTDTCWDDSKIALIGHNNPDERDALSRARSTVARDYMIAKGIAASRIRTAAFGSRAPRRENASNKLDPENRRVELFPDFP